MKKKKLVTYSVICIIVLVVLEVIYTMVQTGF